MRLKLILSLTFLFASIFSFGQKVGSWDMHFSYAGGITQIVDAGNRLYVLTDGKIYSYFPEDNYIETHVKTDRGNSDALKMEYNEKNDALIILRENLDIDILYSNGNFTTISYLKDATQNINKTVNEIYCEGDLAYLSAEFGMLILNVAKEEIKEVGLFNKSFYSMHVFDNYLYAATSTGVIRVLLTQNMQDLTNWEEFDVAARCDDKDFINSSIKGVFLFRDKLSFLVQQQSNANEGLVEVKRIYDWNGETDRMGLVDSYVPLGLLYASNERIIANRWGTIWVINPESKEEFKVPVDEKYLSEAIIPRKGKTDEYWAGIAGHNFSLIKKVEESYEIIEDQKMPNGPASNSAFSLVHEGGKLLVTAGGYTIDRLKKVGYLSYYQNAQWKIYDPQKISSKFGINPRDYTGVISDPSNRNRIFVTSWGDGIYEFLNDEAEKWYTPENTGGVLEDIFGGKDFVRMHGMQFDKSGNLWTTSALVTSPIKVLMKDGMWVSVPHSEIALASSDQITDDSPSTKGLMIDKYNKKWIYSYGGYPYLFILNDKNTPSNTLDDEKRYVDTFLDQDNKSIKINHFFSLQEDQTGNIWVATNVGPYVIYGGSSILNKNTTGAYTRNVVFNKIKIPRNDGTNNVDILLEGTPINALAIDGGSRKWLGTPYGAYLISANGLETIHHFDMDNSPMPSNEVTSLSIDPDNGTVYIGTSKGLVSFVGDATEGKSDYSNVYAFPNPVRPEYEGVITVTGLQTNTNVKITDVRGNILKQGLSLGGQYIWDGRNPSGKRVDTGVYLVLGVTEDGKSGVVTKILVVN